MNEIIGVLALGISAVSYGLYIANTLRGHTRPHAITWLIWAALNSLVFMTQVTNGAGPGAWVTGSAALANMVIFILSLRFGERSINRLDWVTLILVTLLLGLWVQVSDPTAAIVLAVVISALGLLPTILKASRNAHEETALTFALNGTKFLLAMTALSTVTVVTALYPLSLFVMNMGFALYLVVARRRQGPRPVPVSVRRRDLGQR